jgi:structural maintenance of chromosome 3 (chondroitin sulfate proteoglycan 6)
MIVRIPAIIVGSATLHSVVQVYQSVYSSIQNASEFRVQFSIFSSFPSAFTYWVACRRVSPSLLIESPRTHSRSSHMKIKKIVARGFKAYRDLTTVSELDSQLNCVVGYNGSGKSSFFQAIVFVLSPHLPSTSVLHDGNAGMVSSGYVELELDVGIEEFAQIESLLPSSTSSGTITIRRTATQSSGDEFTVNGRSVPRSEYISFLQAVGLLGSTEKSSSKKTRLPYYIVEQGRVASVATISDSGRLGLLKEASGVDVYLEKREESLSILEESRLKRDRVDELLGEIEKRCEGLERESCDLVEYSRLKKFKEFLEYRMISSEMELLVEKRTELERDIAGFSTTRSTHESTLEDLATAKNEIELQIESLTSTDPTTKLLELETEKSVLVGKIASIQSQLDIERSLIDTSTESLTVLNTQLETLHAKKISLEFDANSIRSQISAKSSELSSLQSERTSLVNQQSAVTDELDSSSSLEKIEKRIEICSQQKSALKTRLKFLEAELGEKKVELNRIVNVDIPETTRSVSELLPEVESLERERADQVSHLRQLESFTLKEKQSLVFKMQQEEYGLLKSIDETQKELSGLSSSVLSYSAMVRSIVADPPAGVLGMFGDFIRIPPAYRKAVEAISKRVLYNVIIESDSVADKLAGLSKKSGFVTLTPINRISQARQSVVDLTGKNAQLLSTVITPVNPADWVERLILIHFSQIAVVESVELGAEIAKQFKIDCVTLDGEIVGRDMIFRSAVQRGSGSVSVVQNWQQMSELKSKLNGLKGDQTRVHSDVVLLVSEIKEMTQEIQRMKFEIGETTTNSPKTVLETKKIQLNELRSKLSQLNQRRDEIEQFEIPSIQEGDLNQITAELAAVSGEFVLALEERDAILHDDTQQSTGIDNSQLESRLNSIRERISVISMTAIPAIESELSSLSKSLSITQSELRFFVGSKIEHTEDQIKRLGEESKIRADVTIPGLIREIDVIENNELKECESRIESVRSNAAAWETELENAKNILRTNELRITEIENLLTSMISEYESVSGKLTSVIQEMSVLEMSFRKIPSVPTVAPEFTESIPPSLPQLRAKHLEVSTELNTAPRFEFLNKNSMEQYEMIASDRAQLQSRKNEIEASFRSIQQLLDDLDEKESSQIRSAFEKSKIIFESLFSRVTDGGTAELVMGSGGLSIERVSFSAEGLAKNLNQLSGGQRTVIALCFLLSLNGNFFVLDEVDAALDANYRSAIALAIADLSGRKRIQFLYTSFRPELCSVASKHLLVRMSGGTSWVEFVDRNTAMEFVDVNDDKHVSATPQSVVAVHE